MRVSRSKRSTHTFVLTRPLLEAFGTQLSARLPRIKIKAACSDSLNREFDSFSELFAFRNPERAQITELSIIARNESFADRFSLTLDSDSYKNVGVSVDAEEDIGIFLNDLSDDFVASLRPWYSWIARIEWDYVLFLFGCFLLISSMWRAKSLSFEFPQSIGWLPLSLGVGLGLVPLAATMVLKRMSRRFFPRAAFSIGDGEQRHMSKEITRTVLIAGFLISVISSVVVSWVI